MDENIKVVIDAGHPSKNKPAKTELVVANDNL